MKLYHTAYLAGLLHDMGKYTVRYQDYLEKAARGEKVRRGSVNHTFCGCVYLFNRYHIGKAQGIGTLTCELLAFAVGSHHGEFDCVDLESNSGFEHRLQADTSETGYDEAVPRFLSECASGEEVDRLFALAQEEVSALLATFKSHMKYTQKTVAFLLGMAARMLLSAVIDGDRRDTAEFMSGSAFDFRSGTKELWAAQTAFLEEKLAGFRADSPINRARSHFSEQCRLFAERNGGGIYRMTLPTGGGKTLAALRYALVHAKAHAKKRILFVIPLLSILDQNSAVIRKNIQNKKILTEHHSNVVKTFETKEELDKYELLTETWESPILITTLVQLLNALFSNQTTAIRRMSALSESVIVIDEVQSLPKRVTHMFTMALNFLAYGCGATIVLSSATQPCFDQTNQPLKYSEPADIVPFDRTFFDVFKRTEVRDETAPYGMDIGELAEASVNILEGVSSLLIICNTKESALQLYTELKRRCGGCNIFHLSASMCMKHRTDTLDRINACLRDREKLLCVSTQLVEAGVDFSFESVIRIMAGLDNIAQAAGRCNRHNDFGGLCGVHLMSLKPGAENLRMLREIQTAQHCANSFLLRFGQNPERYENDLLSDASLAEYYSILFAEPDVKLRFAYPVTLSKDHTENLFDLLSDNLNHLDRPKFKDRYFLNQSFKTAGELFEVFDEDTTDLLVPYNDEALGIIADLNSAQAKFDYGFLKACVEKAKPYTIHIFEYQKKKLEEYRMLSPIHQGRFIALDEQCYHPEIGLHIENLIY